MENITDKPILCACGCGQPVKKAKFPSLQRRFINTHQHKGSNNGNYKGGKEKRACPICGKSFYKYPKQVGVTCGDDTCYRKWQGLTTAARGVNKIKTKCAYCGKEIRLFPCQIKKKNYCCKTCMYKGDYAHGSSTGNWKGGKWTFYKRQTLLRDNYRCVICGFDISVDVHHITHIANNGEDDFSNLITLCPNHHRMAHLGVISLDPLRNYEWKPGFMSDQVTLPFANH